MHSDLAHMTPDISKMVVLIAYVSLFAVNFAIKVQSWTVPVAKSRIGLLEILVLIVAVTGFVLPIVWLATSHLAFADYDGHLLPLTAGGLCYALGLCLLSRVAWNLGKFWSPTLQLKENHQLVTKGIYRRIRHPMYLSLLIFSAGNALALPNYVAGPAFFVAMLVIIGFRLGPEERMLLEEFSEQYDAYRKRSYRLIPGLW
jgi:protein-S-isoprenylcysteine O-methyltransferase Ste14